VNPRKFDSGTPPPIWWSFIFRDLDKTSRQIFGYKGLKYQNPENKELSFWPKVRLSSYFKGSKSDGVDV
jgi:hypothetical protein